MGVTMALSDWRPAPRPTPSSNTARTFVETYRRGPFGWLMLVLFWAWHALMAIFHTLVLGMVMFTPRPTPTGAPEQAGYAIGRALSLIVMLTVWALGSFILSLAVYASRGNRVLTEVDH